MKTLFIVDDHQAVHVSYRQFFKYQPGYSVIGHATTGKQALEQIQTRTPDVALIDPLLPDIDGLELTTRLQQVAPAVKILIVSNRTPFADGAFNAGARGLLSKKHFAQQAIPAIDTVLSGGSFFREPLEAVRA